MSACFLIMFIAAVGGMGRHTVLEKRELSKRLALSKVLELEFGALEDLPIQL